MSPETLVYVGRALYGDLWQSQLARAISVGMLPGVSDRAVRYWLAGERPIPGWVPAKLRQICAARKHEILQAEALFLLEGGN